MICVLEDGIILKDKFEDTKEVMISFQSKKDRQKHNRNKKHKQTNNGPQTATQKNRIEEQAPYY